MKLRELRNRKNGVIREDLIFETNKYMYNFQQFVTIRSFARNIYGRKVKENNADEDQNNLLFEVAGFKKNTKP